MKYFRSRIKYAPYVIGGGIRSLRQLIQDEPRAGKIAMFIMPDIKINWIQSYLIGRHLDSHLLEVIVEVVFLEMEMRILPRTCVRYLMIYVRISMVFIMVDLMCVLKV